MHINAERTGTVSVILVSKAFGVLAEQSCVLQDAKNSHGRSPESVTMWCKLWREGKRIEETAPQPLCQQRSSEPASAKCFPCSPVPPCRGSLLYGT